MAQLQPMSQETERVGALVTLSVTAWVLVFGALLCVVAGVVLHARSRTIEPAVSVAVAHRPAPEVSNVRTELFGRGAGDLLKARQRRELEHFGWVDRAHGVVRIPIDVAIQLEREEASR